MSTSVTYTVTGMTCGHCVASVTEELRKIDGVTHVDVDLDSGRVIVESDQRLDDAAVEAAVDEAGYRVAMNAGTKDAAAGPVDLGPISPTARYGRRRSAHVIDRAEPPVRIAMTAPVTEPTNVAAAPTARSVDLAIGGMTCASCAARIEKRLNNVGGVKASVN